MLGGVATASGIALTTTSGWLIVRADQRPQIMLLLTAIVAVRTFGLARPVFRYWERLRSHDAALADLAEARTATYAALIPLTPARLGRRGRTEVLTGVVDDLTGVLDDGFVQTWSFDDSRYEQLEGGDAQEALMQQILESLPDIVLEVELDATGNFAALRNVDQLAAQLGALEVFAQSCPERQIGRAPA